MSAPKATPTILVFDSGAGGLSIAQEILAKRSHCKLIYAADNARFPYGLLDGALLVERVQQLMSSLIPRYSPDVVVIACNTANTLVLQPLRQSFATQFVGVVPAIKPAASLSKTGVIGLLATPATIARDYTNGLVADFAAQHTVLRVGSSQLVKLAEDHILGLPVSCTLIRHELDKFKPQDKHDKLDTIVLACTHFPLLKPYLTTLTGYEHIQWIDSGHAVARRVEHILGTLGFSSDSSHRGPTSLGFCFSNNNCLEIATAYASFLGPDIPFTHLSL